MLEPAIDSSPTEVIETRDDMHFFGIFAFQGCAKRCFASETDASMRLGRRLPEMLQPRQALPPKALVLFRGFHPCHTTQGGQTRRMGEKRRKTRRKEEKMQHSGTNMPVWMEGFSCWCFRAALVMAYSQRVGTGRIM